MKKLFLFFYFFIISFALAEENKTDAQIVLHRFSQGVNKFTLDNGLRVLFFKRNPSPVFAGQLWVKVGGVNEVPGKTGAAHLLEHMAFKGTTKIGTKDYSKEKPLLDRLEVLLDQLDEEKNSLVIKEAKTPALIEEIKNVYQQLTTLWVDNEFSRIYQKNGAVGLNAGTAKDYTMYQIELPNNAFELWCWMESERLLNPVYRQFYKERDVVMEERRMRSDDSPMGKLYEGMLAAAFWSHPYHYPTIGWAHEIQALRTADTRKIYQTYYRPDNMVLSIVGDLDFEKAKPLIEKYFGRLVKPKTAIDVLDIKEIAQDGEREVEVKFDSEPSVIMAYHKPVYPDADDLYFSILHELLSGGRSSILYKTLVLKKQSALAVDTSEAPGELYPSVFYVAATPKQGLNNKELIKEIQAIFDRLSKEGFSDEDFNAAKKRVKLGFISSLGSNEGLAEMLGHADLLWGDWQEIFKMYDLINGATKENVTSLFGKYLKVSNRTIARLERK